MAMCAANFFWLPLTTHSWLERGCSKCLCQRSSTGRWSGVEVVSADLGEELMGEFAGGPEIERGTRLQRGAERLVEAPRDR